ncbi:MAG: M48 family metallopeptidase, partial [Planctomycetota bacterium]|nr:M48 family metallopeptidase [Planctomycetota bacterium]
MHDSPYNPKEAFEGRLRGKSIRGGSCDAQILVNTEGIHAQSEEITQTLPYRGLRLRRDDSGALIATSGDGKWSVSCLDKNFERALETMAGNDLNQQLTTIAGQKTSSRSKHLLGCSLVLVLFGAVLWSIPKLFNGTIEASVAALPMSVDEALGEAAQESMDAGGSLVEDEVVVQAVQTIVDRLAPHAALEGLEYQFRVVRNDDANAYALPGGFITVFTGLIEQSTSPDQVAGVIAHEMAHAKLRPGLLKVAHAGAFSATMAIVFGNLGGLESIAIELFTLQQVNDHSQDAETEADVEGVRIMVAAGINPQGLIDSFKTMQERYGDISDGLAWTSSHPQFDDRIASIEQTT